MVFWRGGLVWGRANAYGWGLLQYLRKHSMLISVTPRSLRAFSLSPKGRRTRFIAPAGFVLANYALGIDRPREGMVAVAMAGEKAPYFQPLATFRVEVVDLVNGDNAAAPLDGFPLGFGFTGHTLIAGTCLFPPSLSAPTQRKFYLDTFSIKTINGSLILQQISHKRCAGPLESFAGGRPVLVTTGEHRVFVGRTRVNVPLGGGKISQVVGAPHAILVVESDGSYGVARTPNWKYRRVGRLTVKSIIGSGHNRSGFWLAQEGNRFGTVRITEITTKGVAQTMTIKISQQVPGKPQPAQREK
jgi:hypothetical protein